MYFDLSIFLSAIAVILTVVSIIIATIANRYAYKNLLDSQLNNLASNCNSLILKNPKIGEYSEGDLSILLTNLHYVPDLLRYFENKSTFKNLNRRLMVERKDIFYIQLNSSIKLFLAGNFPFNRIENEGIRNRLIQQFNGVKKAFDLQIKKFN